ncbi:hypothetical protein DAPPUDRAFT_254354 [Daphnia pulex]|uniref:Uncharacterized protein n=1 Tax=Daphnia pulex TaxID=6669 RepID=E9H6Z4_DAPPU|nr:hypothetical protein DAPPUDRAFT_254354 [Daphnia pulex]|eukprot:EFX72527.1 hypothetical protein DAPPUDRAFT_254354 [Daphnia pulex]
MDTEGRFGQFNRPGYPNDIMLVCKFGSYATVLCPISKMTTPIVDLNESEDIIPLWPSTLSKLPRRRNSPLSRALHAAQHEERKESQRKEKAADRKRKEAAQEKDKKARQDYIRWAIQEAERIRKRILADRAAEAAAKTQQLAAVQEEEIEDDDILQIQEESQDEFEHT